MASNFDIKREKRAPFPGELTEIRRWLPPLIPVLEAEKDWYGSVYFERKRGKHYQVDLKGSDMDVTASMGVVLRIYDGYTLYEQATDELSEAGLKKSAEELVTRVRKGRRAGTRRPYDPPGWKDRLSAGLSEEIRMQVPENAGPSTEVHFGIRFHEDPTLPTDKDHINLLTSTLERVKRIGAEHGLEKDKLGFLRTIERLTLEDAIFVDRRCNMSQTLYRLALTVIAVSGPERIYSRVGGLGGMEAVHLPEKELQELMEDLAGLRRAGRLEPGKYRVLFAPGLTGVLAHEAFGHSQEGDTCARGRSKAWDLYKSGERVGNEHATILNSPAVYDNGEDHCGAWGSYFFDEEGWLASEQVLLDKGRLQAPMTNLTSALRLGVPRTANGKRESFSAGVYTRQTNTYFSSGDSTYAGLMEKLGDGYLATHCAGGMEDPKGMGIQVGILFLKEVKGGKLTGKYLRGPAGGDIQMTGYTPDVLNSIVDKSKIEAHCEDADTALHPWNEVGGCGKYHKEYVHAGCGGPYMLLDQVILG